MKKLITGLVVGALCCMLFSTPAFPTKYDPSRPPPTPYWQLGPGSSTGDDTPWDDPVMSPSIGGNNIIIRTLSQTPLFYLAWLKLTGAFADSARTNLIREHEDNTGTEITGNIEASGR